MPLTSGDGTHSSSQTWWIHSSLQLLFGHEPAPIAGETFDDEQQGRSITESMAERLTRQQSATKAWLQAEAESRVERAQNRRTRAVLHWLSGTSVCYWRADVSKHGFSTNDSTRIYRHTEQAQRSLVGSYDCRSQERHEEPHSTVWWIVVQGRLLRCALEHLRHLSERESLALDPDKKATEKARTFTDIVNDFKFSSGTHADLRSQPDSPDGSEPRHHHGKIFESFICRIRYDFKRCETRDEIHR